VFTNLAGLKKSVITKSEFSAEFSAKSTGFNGNWPISKLGTPPVPSILKKKIYCFREFLLTLRPCPCTYDLHISLHPPNPPRRRPIHFKSHRAGVKSAATMEVGDLNKVWEIRALKTKPEAAAAREVLDRVARQVQPIMRRHKWRVKVLSEFS
jgi:hypothetical protein